MRKTDLKERRKTMTRKEQQAKTQRICQEYDLFHANTLRRLYHWVLQTEDYPFLQGQEEAALIAIGAEIERLRYNFDVSLANIRRLQAENESLRQLDLFRKL